MLDSKSTLLGQDTFTMETAIRGAAVDSETAAGVHVDSKLFPQHKRLLHVGLQA